MGFNLTKVGRTKITISGKFPEKTAKEVFNKVCGARLADMGYEYDPESDETTINLYPCIIQNIESEVRYGDKVATQYEKRIVMLGVIPPFVDFYSSYWDRIKECANNVVKRAPKKKKKKGNDGDHNEVESAEFGEIRWVTMYYPKRVTTPFNEVATELGFIVDGRCKRVSVALDEATKAVRDKLQLICRDVNPALMTSAHLLDEISMDMADAIHKLEDDATSERYAELGIRKVDTDDLVFGDSKTVHSER